MLQQQTQSPGWRVLNRDVIKYIAMTAMLLNHIANIFLVPGTLWYEVLVDIGYFTAITMCYFLVEGFRYTHSRKQYALRLFGFGVVSQVPFSMAFAQNGILEFQDFNMMFTLFLCFCILLCIETIRNRFLCGVLIVLLILVRCFVTGRCWPRCSPCSSAGPARTKNDCGSVLRFLPRCLAG